MAKENNRESQDGRISDHEHGQIEGAKKVHEDKTPAKAGIMGQMEHDGHGKKGGQHEGHREMLADFRRRFILSTLVTIPILILTEEVQDLIGYDLQFTGSGIVLLVLSSFVYFYGGYPFIKGLFDEIKKRQPGMMTLIAVAISVSYFYSAASMIWPGGHVFFWELATLIDIMLLGHWVEMRSVLGASRALEELVKIMPSEAHLMLNGGIKEVKIEELKVGDHVLVKPGEKIPIDGNVVEGETSVNQAMLTGESQPVSKKIGDMVIGGAINGEGSIVIDVAKIGKDTYLNQVIDLVKKAQESRSGTQDLADRAALILVIVALSVGAITFIAWSLAGQGTQFAIDRAVTVMVISCPHALGLAIPLVVAVSTSLAAKAGLLIRERQAFERAKDLEAIVFDKTGTLTQGKFGVTDVIVLSDLEEDAALGLGASLEALSEHPIARGIVAAAEDRDLKLNKVEAFRAIPGKGVEGLIEGIDVKAVSPGYLQENGITLDDDRVEKAKQQGKTVIFVIRQGTVMAAIGLADIIRPESKEAVAKLRSMGFKCMMLTGDNKFVAKWVSDELDLDDFFAEVLPHEKADIIKRIQEKYAVAMVGDGINDAPALIQADVGIAIGAGTDVAVESADIVLVRNDPRDVTSIISLSKRTYSKMIQNLVYGTGYNSFAIPLAAGALSGFGIILSPAIGAVLMSVSTVIVAINARLLKMERTL